MANHSIEDKIVTLPALSAFKSKADAAYAAGNSSHKAVATAGILYGAVDSTSTATDFTANVEGLTSLYDGATVFLKNGVVTSASGFTININGLGDKPVYNNMATGNDITPTDPTRDTTIFNINYTMLFVYSTDIVEGGGWICYRGYDANTNTIGYQLRTNSCRRPASDKGYRYRLWFSSANGQQWVPANTSTATDATTSRTLNTRAIDPFGPIIYYSYNGTTNASDNLTANVCWQQYTLTIGYSYVKTLTAWDPVYLKCSPNTDGSAVMKDIVQALPSSKDGFIYIFLGIAYSTTGIELWPKHPVYWHDGTGIRLWTGAEPSSGGSTVSVTQSLSSGTKIGTVTVDGTGTDLYAPTNTPISMTDTEVDAAVNSAIYNDSNITITITNNSSSIISIDKTTAKLGDVITITNLSDNNISVTSNRNIAYLSNGRSIKRDISVALNGLGDTVRLCLYSEVSSYTFSAAYMSGGGSN